MPKSSSTGINGPESEKTFSDLLMCYALAIQATWLACNRLQQAIFRLASEKSPTRRFSVVCGRPVSEFSSTAGRKLRVVGRSVKLTLVDQVRLPEQLLDSCQRTADADQLRDYSQEAND